ncbi:MULTISPECIES: WXG100 family type VII secretion target [Neobacillus]|uniref:WXG100 family type VII secretion target n=1 Tax=Neobacillus rhizophilus TaxID=2833579 RepID=A0A942U596_9BACI|nr:MULTISPECIES: WXG100 family type VII secretion target [Neobacillus]MBS4212963.1 WXG100 family type VII secretion target [Neobacillus rhizophilus]MBU8918179.1 WXG100 family type VII secretion target [Bacillus sp. FJAT-29953]
MAGSIKVSTAQVADIANTIERLNQQLLEELKNSQSTIKNLTNTWEGEAAQATVSAYDEFSAKYFQTYYEILDNYVKFLRVNVDQGYFETETANVNLADAFK